MKYKSNIPTHLPPDLPLLTNKRHCKVDIDLQKRVRIKTDLDFLKIATTYSQSDHLSVDERNWDMAVGRHFGQRRPESSDLS